MKSILFYRPIPLDKFGIYLYVDAIYGLPETWSLYPEYISAEHFLIPGCTFTVEHFPKEVK